MKTVPPRVLPVLLAAALAAPAFAGDREDAVIPPLITLENAQVRLTFRTQQPGSSLELVSVANLSDGLAPISMALGSGGWSVKLVVKDTGAADWMSFSMDGTVDSSGPGVGTLDELSLLSVTLGPGTLTALWTGEVTISETNSAFELSSTWTLVPDQPQVDTTLALDLLQPGLLPFYTSTLDHPVLRVAAFGTPGDVLLVPRGSGSLIRDPTSPALPFDASLASGNNFFPVGVAAYYDGQAPSNCLTYATTDGDASWKEIHVSVGEDSESTRYVGFTAQYVPEDLFDNKNPTLPFTVRLSAEPGDWWDVAQRYRKLLTITTPWHHGPVGAATNPTPDPMKDAVAEVLLIPGYEGDHMDLLARQMMNITRVVGPNANAIWYGAHAPDDFGHWFFGGGYLPGRPSFVGAVRGAQKQYAQVVSPYFNGSSAGDYTDPALDPPITEPTQLMLDAFASFLIGEDGQPHYVPSPLGPPRIALLCPQATWWRTAFAQAARDILLYTGAAGMYLDYFLTGPCYSTAHDHAPGGGSWMYTSRMDQIRDLAAAPHDNLIMPMEFAIGRFSEEIHGMHVDPAENLMSAEMHPNGFTPKPMANAVTVPFFRAVHDDVKLSRITARVPTDPGRRSWVEANNVFTFGQVPGITRSLADLIPVFSQRFAFAPSYTHVDPDGTADGFFLPQNQPQDNLPPSTPFEPQKDAFNVPYLRFLGDLTRVLREHGFLTWHNGTVRRLPPFQIVSVTPPGFDGVPGVELDPDDGLQTNTPVYVEQLVVPGLFQAPGSAGTPVPGDAASLAFVLANPWVDPGNPATLEMDFQLDASGFPGWSASTPYSVTHHDEDGMAQTLPATFQGPFDLGAVSGTQLMAPGDIDWWVFRRTLPGR